MFYSVNKYLYSINNILFLNILEKILFFNRNVKYRLAWVYYKNSNYKRSINILKKCNNIESNYLLANNYEQIKCYNEAIEIYTKILLADRKERPDILYNRGAMYKTIGKYDEAIIDFNGCINCNEPDPKAFYALGAIKDEMGEFEKAKEYFSLGISLDDSYKEYIPEKYK
jgi:tetratricopeptide (TPR) repeat protein